MQRIRSFGAFLNDNVLNEKSGKGLYVQFSLQIFPPEYISTDLPLKTDDCCQEGCTEMTFWSEKLAVQGSKIGDKNISILKFSSSIELMDSFFYFQQA